MPRKTIAELEKRLAERERYIAELENALNEEQVSLLDALAELRDKSRLVDAYEMLLSNNHKH